MAHDAILGREELRHAATSLKNSGSNQQLRVRTVVIRTLRLTLTEFQMSDAQDVFGCITPAITRFVFWDVPPSFDAYRERREQWLKTKPAAAYSFVIRRADTAECLGVASLEDGDADAPEVGIWLKEAAHGNGYGTEAIRGLLNWASRTLEKHSFLYA
ncbi:MAG TPA: GNAT family N-acetyltransferase, partial [Candidatus Elarobacter sp.]|nr:GNAT family N-acetyltransferase [Candidatus Elarobacter sp.]